MITNNYECYIQENEETKLDDEEMDKAVQRMVKVIDSKREVKVRKYLKRGKNEEKEDKDENKKKKDYVLGKYNNY